MEGPVPQLGPLSPLGREQQNNADRDRQEDYCTGVLHNRHVIGQEEDEVLDGQAKEGGQTREDGVEPY